MQRSKDFGFFFNGIYFVGCVSRNKEEDMDVLSRNCKERKNALFDELTNFVHNHWMPNNGKKKKQRKILPLGSFCCQICHHV